MCWTRTTWTPLRQRSPCASYTRRTIVFSLGKHPSRSPFVEYPYDEQVDILDGFERQRRMVEEVSPKRVEQAVPEVEIEAGFPYGALPCATDAEMDTVDADRPSADYVWDKHEVSL